MRPERLLIICVLPLLYSGCGSERIVGLAEGLTHAAAAAQCAPADGPAVSIYLASAPVQSLEPAAPYVRADVWQPLERLRDRPWELGGVEADGHATYYSGAPDHELATAGRVTVTGVASDNTITGSLDLTFPTLGRVQGVFEATWIPRPTFCG